jgi:hypothetical protein
MFLIERLVGGEWVAVSDLGHNAFRTRAGAESAVRYLIGLGLPGEYRVEHRLRPPLRWAEGSGTYPRIRRE